MASQAKRTRPLFLFYLLVVYVFLQFIWWSYLMVKLNNEVLEQRLQIIELSLSNAAEIEAAKNELHTKIHKRWMMIAGEGSVFLALLVLGTLRTRNTFKAEAELTHQQKNFLLSVTHELKSPIASAKLQLEALLKHNLDKEKQKEILSNALADTERLHILVENVLMATKLETSNYSLFRENINLSDFVQTEIEKISHRLQAEKRHDVKLEIAPHIFFSTDTFAFTSILNNVYENAVKYSPEKFSIIVRLEKTENAIKLSIVDFGMGIIEEEKQKIFEKFYRVGNEEMRNTKGTGLGLYIVKQLVQNHEGTIKVKNNSPQGSIFEITFPIQQS